MDDPARSPSPSPQLDEPLPPLPSLPVEILQRIIQLAAPGLCLYTFSARYDILAKLSRVNKLWAALAQRELYRHVGFDEDAQARQFWSRLLKSDKPGRLVRSLMVNSDESTKVTTYRLRELLYRCSGLQTLRFTASFPVQTSVDFEQLARDTPGIREIAVEYCRAVPKSPSSHISLPNLRCLYLSTLSSTACSIGTLLLALDAPSLDTLFITDDSSVLGANLHDLEAGICKAAPRLRTFGLSLTDKPTPSASMWSSFVVLKNLTLDSDERLPDVLHHLTTTLDHLRFRPATDQWITFTSLLDALRLPPAALASLLLLSLPPVAPLDWHDIAEDHQASLADRAEVVRICGEKGIELQEVMLLQGGDYIEHLEDMLALW